MPDSNLPQKQANEVAIERRFTVGDMEYAAKIWGDPAAPPVLALHGWLDNAASFDILAPLLNSHSVVAVDLAGHGLSSHRPHNGSYLIWSDLLELLDIADQLEWDKFDVLGHSRGGMISTLLAIAAPERVGKLVTLDTLMPISSSPNDATNNLRQYIRDERKFLQRKEQQTAQKPFADLDRAIKARQALMPIADESARKILTRGTRAVDGGFVWRHDERLKGRSAVKLSKEQNDQLLADLEAPTLCLHTDGALRMSPDLAVYGREIKSIHLQRIDGNHHFHMEQQAPEAAERISSFLFEGSQ